MILNNKRHAFDSNQLWWTEITVSTELSQVPVLNTPLNGLSKNILYVDETGLQVCVCVWLFLGVWVKFLCHCVT